MLSLPLVLLLTLAAGPSASRERPPPAGCREDHGTCKEDCTIELGGSTTKYRELEACLNTCAVQLKACSDRYYTLKDSAPKPQPAPEPVLPPEPPPSPMPVAQEPEPVVLEQEPVAQEPEPVAKEPMARQPEPAPVAAPEPREEPAPRKSAPEATVDPAMEALSAEVDTPAAMEPEPAPQPEPKPEPVAAPAPKPEPKPAKAKAKSKTAVADDDIPIFGDDEPEAGEAAPVKPAKGKERAPAKKKKKAASTQAKDAN